MSFQIEQRAKVDMNHQVLLDVPSVPVGAELIIRISDASLAPPRRKPVFDSMAGRISVTKEFFEPLEEFEPYS